MIVLLNQYKNARKELRNMLAALGDSERDIDDKKKINSMINSTSDIIEWLETGVNPYFQQGIDVNHAYHIKHMENMDLIPDIAEQITEEREPLVLTDEQKKVLQKVFNTLSDRERDCFLLHEGQNMSMSEVGEKLGISKASVQTYVKRAKEKVKELVR